MINIIHLYGTEFSEIRYASFMKELKNQNVQQYKIWEGIKDKHNVTKAINLSHKQIVKWAKEASIKEICIMEDDAYFTGLNAFNFFILNKPDKYSLYLGGISNLIKRKDDYITDFRGMTLYFIHEQFYDVFLSVPENVNIDAGLKGLGKYYLCPKIVCSQKAGYSYHKKRHKDYSHLLKQYDVYGGE